MLKIFARFLVIASVLFVSPVVLAQELQDADIDSYASMIGDDSKSTKVRDPFESYNRKIFSFNDKLNSRIIHPIARLYEKIPETPRGGIEGFFNFHYETQWGIIYSLAQFDLEGILITGWRFVLNATFGGFGAYNIAADFGLRGVSKGVDQTLARYGLSTGPYFVLPVLGSSTLTDSFEIPVSIFLAAFNPYSIGGVYAGSGKFVSITFSGYMGYNSFSSAMSTYGALSVIPAIINKRIYQLDIFKEMDNNSIDRYVAYRDYYLKMKKFSIDEENKAIKEGRFERETPIALSHHARIDKESYHRGFGGLDWSDEDEVTDFSGKN